jgi:hypothetical protein
MSRSNYNRPNMRDPVLRTLHLAAWFVEDHPVVTFILITIMVVVGSVVLRLLR